MAEEFSMDASAMPEVPQDMQSQELPAFDMNAVTSSEDVDGGPKKPPIAQRPVQRPGSAPQDAFDKQIREMSDNVDYEFASSKLKNKTFEDRINPIEGPGVRFAGDDLDLYRYQDGFNPEGFDPFNEGNYQHWSEKETWSTALGKGMDSFATRFGNTYKDSFASYGRMADALFNWDWEKMMPDSEEMQEMNWAEYKESMKNFVFIDPKEEEDIISKRSVSEFLGNAGFALGTIGALGTELIADAALTYVTGGAGAGSFAATAAKFTGLQAVKAAARQGIKSMGLKGMAKAGDFLGDVGKGAFHYANESAESLSATGKVVNKAEQAKVLADAGKVGSTAFRDSMKEVLDMMSFNTRGILKSKTFPELLTNVVKGVPLVGTGVRYGEKIVAGAKGGLSTGKLVGIGLQGTRRIAQELNMSSTEAGFEAVTTYGSTLDLMVENHRSRNEGENPTPEEFAKMQDKAWQASTANYNTNLALLLATNRLQFGGLFNRFAAGSKWGKEILEEGVEKAFAVNAVFKGTKKTAQVYQKGFFGTYGLTGKIAKDFGKKQAAYEFGKQFLKDTAKFQISEGLQENLQETSASAWMNYYAGQYEGTKTTLSQAFSKGMDEQFTKQGLRTFLQGALTGVLISPVTSVQGKVMQRLQEKSFESQYKDNPSENPYIKMKEQLKKDIDLQNEFFNQVSNKKMQDNVVNFTSHVDNTMQQTEAAAKGAQYEWQNHKDNIVLAGALAANRTGTINAYKQSIRQLGEDMSNEEFETSFGIKLEDTKYSAVAEFAEDMASDVGKYSDTIDAVRKKVKKLPDPLMYEKGSKDRLVATIMHYAQEEAVKIIALNTLKGTRAAERATNITQDLMAIPGLENSSDYAIRTLTNPENFQAETGNIMAEIRILQEGLEVADTDLKKDIQEKIKIKQKKLDLLDKWLNFWGTEDVQEERTDVKTGEKVTQSTKAFTTFRGVEQTVEERDENGNVINAQAKVNRLDHEDVRNTFREFINLANAEAGIKTELSEQSLFDGFDKIIDYIRLDKDSKDYLKSIDVLFNPQNYSQLVGRIQDGRFKFELLQFVDSLNDRLRGALVYAFRSSFESGNPAITGLVEDFEENFMKIYDSLTKELKDNDAYKNLVTVIVTEEFGTDSSKFVMENMKKLNDFLLFKINEIFDKYASPEVTEDIDENEYNEFKKTKKISQLTLNNIARKIKKGTRLTEKEGKVYDEHRTEIIEIKKLQDEFAVLAAEEISNAVVGNGPLIDELKSRLIQTGEFTQENLDVLESSQIFDIAFEKGLLSADELSFQSESGGVVSDEVYTNFQANPTIDSIPEDLRKTLAIKASSGLPMSDREQEIFDELKDEISAIPVTNDEEEVTNEEASIEEATPEPEDTVEVVPSVTETTDVTDANQESSQVEDTDALAFFGLGAESTVESTPEGFNALAPNGTQINDESVETAEEATGIAEAFDKGKANLTWSTEFFRDTEAKGNLDKIKDFIKRANTSLTIFNKTAETPLQTLEDYYKTPFGRKKLNVIRESVLTGKSTKELENAAGPTVALGTQVDLFETTTSTADGPALTLSSLQSLYEELKSMSQASTVSPSPATDKKAERIFSLNMVIGSYEDDVIPEAKTERKNLISQKNLASNPDLVSNLEAKIKEYDDAIKGYEKSLKEAKQELTTLETQTSTTEVSGKIDTFVEKGDVTEQSILDQLDDIHSCF